MSPIPVLILLAVLFILLFFLTFIDKDKPVRYRLKKASVGILIFFLTEIILIGGGVFLFSRSSLNQDDLMAAIGITVMVSIVTGFVLALTVTQRIIK